MRAFPNLISGAPGVNLDLWAKMLMGLSRAVTPPYGLPVGLPQLCGASVHF